MPSLITGAALISLATACGVGPQGEAAPVDLLVRIVMHESGGNPTVTNGNRNGTTDYGLAQINSSNLGWLRETSTTILDPCRNIAAEARILRGFSAYATGSPTKGFVLRPPGQDVSYVESMSDPRYRDTAHASPTMPASPRRAQLLVLSSK